MRAAAPFCACALAAFVACGRRVAPDPLPVREVRQAEASLGFEPTRNFRRHGGRTAYHLCYATGPLELPVDYRGLRLDERRAGVCRFDASKLDVFVYPAEALAGRKTPVTESLAAADPRRPVFFIAHEDFHEQPGVRQLDPALKEAAAMLAGFLASAESSRLRGDAAGAAQALGEAELFLSKARRVNAAHAELSAVYASYRRGEISRPEALARKRAVFERLARECVSLAAEHRAFHPCPAALNNAGLAFDATYTREYPRVHAILRDSAGDPKTAVRLLRRLAEAE